MLIIINSLNRLFPSSVSIVANRMHKLHTSAQTNCKNFIRLHNEIAQTSHVNYQNCTNFMRLHSEIAQTSYVGSMHNKTAQPHASAQ